MKALCSLCVLVLAAFSLGSGLKGQVTLANGQPAANAVVYLEGGAHAGPLPKAMVDQRERTFIPHVSVVTVGTKVAFPNNDTIFHNVFADYNAKKFNLGLYARGQTKYQVFPKTGLVVLFCSIHPDMLAYIMVVDTPYYAVADSHGRFSIKDVPSGSYELKAWHESGQQASTEAHISGESTLNVSVRRG